MADTDQLEFNELDGIDEVASPRTPDERSGNSRDRSSTGLDFYPLTSKMPILLYVRINYVNKWHIVLRQSLEVAVDEIIRVIIVPNIILLQLYLMKCVTFRRVLANSQCCCTATAERTAYNSDCLLCLHMWSHRCTADWDCGW